MAKKFAELHRIDNDHKITKDTDVMFLYRLQNVLLMALKEHGRLNELQYREACVRLKEQWRIRVRKLQGRGECR